MDAEKLQRIEDIYHEALDVSPGERPQFVRERCGGDEEIRREVDSLLSFEESTPESFIDGSAGSLAAEMLLPDAGGTDLSGTTVGHYLVESKIGTGGMGVVYLAQDTRLDRKVAIKFLNKEFSNDDAKLRRFVQEAKAASALNHPNILTVFEIGDSEDTRFIVTEWIDGLTLREYLAQTDRPRLSALLDVGSQIAEALGAAHQAGIIHRDIKPENIMVRRDGYAKILDFGLAKLAEMPGFVGGPANQPGVKTHSGIIMGTVSYMSPEQARGKVVDARTDLWSLGVVLHEMYTGSLPFQGDTMSDTVASILTAQPSRLESLVTNVPARLQAVIDRTMAKDVSNRYSEASELRKDLLAIRNYLENNGNGEPSHLLAPTQIYQAAGTDTSALGSVRTQEARQATISIEIEKIRNRYRFAAIAAVVVIVSAGIGFAGYRYFVPKPAVETLFNKTTFEKIAINGNVELTAISPDKRYLAYVARKNSNETKLVLRQMENGAEKEILPMGISYVRDIKFSPDGNYFYYAYETMATSDLLVNVFRVPLLGGEPEKIVEDITRTFSLTPDGGKIAFIRTESSPFDVKLVVRDLETKQEQILIASKDRHLQSVAFSPDGAKIAVFATDSGVNGLFKLNWIPAEGGELRKVSDTALKEDGSLDWLNDGSGLVISGQFPEQKYGQLYKIPFPQGEYTPLTTSTSTFSRVSVSKDGNFLVALQTNKTNGIWELDLGTRAARQIIQTTKDELKVEDATTDNRLLITRTDIKGKDGLLLISADGATEKFLTLYDGENSGPLQRAAITNDEKYCYYVSDNDVWRIGLDGSGKEQLTNTPSIKKIFGAIAPDSTYVLFGTVDPYSIQKLDVVTRSVSPVFEREDYSYVIFGFARDKNLIAHTARNEKNPEQVTPFLLSSFDGQKVSEPKHFVSVTRSKGFALSKDGNKAYFTPYIGNPTEINDTEMAEKDLLSGKLTKITNFNIERILSYTISRDGTKLYLLRGNKTDEVTLIKNVE
ncbi:MAG: protein kinase [Pyrinomonadaceae bacterium]